MSAQQTTPAPAVSWHRRTSSTRSGSAGLVAQGGTITHTEEERVPFIERMVASFERCGQIGNVPGSLKAGDLLIEGDQDERPEVGPPPRGKLDRDIGDLRPHSGRGSLEDRRAYGDEVDEDPSAMPLGQGDQGSPTSRLGDRRRDR